MNYHQLQSIRLLQQGHGADWLREDMESRTDTYCVGGDVSAFLQPLHHGGGETRCLNRTATEQEQTCSNNRREANPVEKKINAENVG